MVERKSELEFESELVDYIAKIGGTRQWQKVELHTNEELWANFKRILEQNNQDKLEKPLSDTEFEQVKASITKLNTPYEAGQFLYGVGGKSQIEVDLDDGSHRFLTVFDQDQIGGGTTQYQVTTQIRRPAVIPGKENRRFDTTMLINGLPIIQIEEKADGHQVDEALNQIEQYLDEGQYGDIFSVLQIWIAMTPHHIKYMAVTDIDHFNTDFAFQWQRFEDNKPVNDWREFSNLVLSIPMAHRMATNYMILDGNSKNPNIKVMRPYQVYATKRVIDLIKKHDFEHDAEKRLGYVWHATGSGKTISSFKASWLASRLPNVDKVVFLVDRVALTNQTVEQYKAYDPESDENNENGVVVDTSNRYDLERKLYSNDSTVIVTSTQKMAAMVRDKENKKSKRIERIKDKHTVFVVDEAHRSTSGEMLEDIKKFFAKSVWVGYTGTPIFPDSYEIQSENNGKKHHKITTYDVFGNPIAIYNIRNAIQDGNVLGFKVDFENTLPQKELKEKYLPEYFKRLNPKISEDELKYKIDHMSPEDMDDAVQPTVYDNNEDQVKAVVDNIIKYWPQRSHNYKYNALLTTHVGGNRASTPMAMMYYREFKRRNKELDRPLKFAVTFSADKTNGNNMLENNRSLHEAIDDYNKMFNTHFEDKDVKEYTAQVVARLNRTINDNQYLDLVIVIDQLLTGFDAPQLNTLYVDRTLKGASLIQAYSRTNRVYDNQTKTFGHIVSFRWPSNSKRLMDEALAKYANSASANVQTELFDDGDDGSGDGILANDYKNVVNELKKVVEHLKKGNITDNITRIPADSDQNAQDQMASDLRKYTRLLNSIKQYKEYAEEKDAGAFLKKIGLTEEQEIVLSNNLAKELASHLAKRNVGNPDSSVKLDLRVEHVQEVEVNYSYLYQLIAEMMNAYHEKDYDSAKEKSDEIKSLTACLDDDKEARKIDAFTDNIMNGRVSLQDYPYEEKSIPEMIVNHCETGAREAILEWKKKWGVVDIKHSRSINDLIDKHVEGNDDLNIDRVEDTIIKEATEVYRTDAENDEIRGLAPIKYRNEFRKQFQELADRIKREY